MGTAHVRLCLRDAIGDRRGVGIIAAAIQKTVPCQVVRLGERQVNGGHLAGLPEFPDRTILDGYFGQTLQNSDPCW